MKEILFCGGFIPPEINEKVKHNSPAANNFQKELIANLSKNYKVDILTYVGFYEEDMDIVIESFKKHSIYYVIKQENKNYISVFYRYYKLFNKLIHNKQAVILYNYNYINLFINYFCKKKKIKTILIVADHAEYYEYKNPIRSLLAFKYFRDYFKFDHLIFLSKRLKEKYNMRNSILMEGGINNAKYINFTSTPKENKIILLFSGSLSKVMGIDIYLKAIELIKNESIRFLFSGKGDMKNFLIERSKKDKRIEYIGFLEEKEYLLLLNKANILINPRNMDLPQNQNNFPSKILEYLATGKVIISTEFPNFQNFKENIYFCKSESQVIANKIRDICDKYNSIYKEVFIKNREKSKKYEWSLQVKKIEKIVI